MIEDSDEKFNMLLSKYTMPHIGLTIFKYRAKAAGLLLKKGFKLTTDSFIILKILSEVGCIAQNDLAGILYKNKSNFSRMVDSLEKDGYIERKADIKDKRAVKILYPTPKAKDLAKKATPLAEEFQKKALKGISKKELDTVKSVMAKIRANLD